MTTWAFEDDFEALQTAEDSALDGFWVVAMISCDRGPAFDSVVVAQGGPNVPLVAPTVFAYATEIDGPEDGLRPYGQWKVHENVVRHLRSGAYPLSSPRHDIEYVTVPFFELGELQQVVEVISVGDRVFDDDFLAFGADGRQARCSEVLA